MMPCSFPGKPLFFLFPTKRKTNFPQLLPKNQTKYSNVVIELSSRFHGKKERESGFSFLLPFSFFRLTSLAFSLAKLNNDLDQKRSCLFERGGRRRGGRGRESWVRPRKEG